MSGPDNAATQQDDAEEESTENVESFETKVNSALSAVTVDENGKQVLPDGLDEPTKYAVQAELRRRHTQSEFDKNRNSLRIYEAENEELRKLIEPKLDLTTEQKEELEDLKISNPEVWRKKLTEYESEARKKVDESLSGVKLTASQKAEVERRKEILSSFRTANPELGLNDEVLANDIPPRIKSKIEKGEITYEEFLEESKKFLLANKKVGSANSDNSQDPDLNSVGGGSSAPNDAIIKDIEDSYETEIF